jgi:hypothetical protein
LRSRFSRSGLPNVPLINDPLTSLEASLPAPPRRPRSVARKRVAKKLKVTETTSQEVNSSSRVVEYMSCNNVLAGDSAFRPHRPRGRRRLETVGEPAERNRSPSPTVEELVSRLTQRSTTIVEPHAPVVKNRTEPTLTVAAEEPAAAEAKKEVPAKAGLVDIASILGAPTVTVFRSSL